MSDKANALWRRFSGIFGSEALTRKFGDTPPDEWVSQISKLNDFELAKGMRRLLHSGKAYVPTLPEFLKLCREIGGEIDADENRKPLAISYQGPQMDEWEMCANRHLLAFILRQQNLYKRGFNESETMLLVEGKKAWAVDMRDIHGTDKAPEDHGKDWFNQYMDAAIAQMVPASYAGGALA